MEESKRENLERKIRIDKSLFSVDKYTLKIKPLLESNSFEGQVKIDITIKDQDIIQIFLHMQNLDVNLFQISFGETLNDGMLNKDE